MRCDLGGGVRQTAQGSPILRPIAERHWWPAIIIAFWSRSRQGGVRWPLKAGLGA
jgi:hypothetical protein